MKRCATRTKPWRWVSLLLAAGSLAGCAADSVGRASGEPQQAEPTAPAGSADNSASDLPAVSVRNLATGGTTNLQSLLPAAKPLVVWFWAPY